jgi:hypothetical protein
LPTELQLHEALAAAGAAHHDYETNFLKGVRDEQWAGWYAAFVVGRLGSFTAPTLLAEWLSDVSGDGDWASHAAAYVLAKINS